MEVHFHNKYKLYKNKNLYVKTYINDVTCLSDSNWNDHLGKVDQVLQCLKDAGLKVNGDKSYFSMDELEYLGYKITCKGVKPVLKKITTILDIKHPKTRKQLRSFIGMVNYYRNMWI